MTDDHELQSLAASDASGFAALVEPHVRSMSHLAAQLAPVGERDDVVQESLTRAWLKRTQFDGGRGTLRSWLLAITADQARRARRRARARPTSGLWSPSEADVRDTVLDLRAAVASLPSRQQLAVRCFYFADLTLAETAVVMKCAEGTVKATLHQARRTLHQVLGGNHGS